MSLINCPECNKEVSDKAIACINCGAPIHEQDYLGTEVILEKEDIAEDDGPNEVFSSFENREQALNFWSFTQAKILLGLVIVSLCLSIFSFFNSMKVKDIEQQIFEVEQKNIQIEEEVRLIENNDKFLTNWVRLISMGAEMSEGVVTDKVVVQKATFYILDSWSSPETTYGGSIDIRPQPSYSSKFLGKGDFDLTDRELKSMLEEIMNEVIEYGSFDGLTLKTVYITANNYKVAEYIDGEITLAGE